METDVQGEQSVCKCLAVPHLSSDEDEGAAADGGWLVRVCEGWGKGC